MRIDESVDWGCGCWIMKEFDTHSHKLRTVGRSYCRSKQCNRKLATIKQHSIARVLFQKGNNYE